MKTEPEQPGCRFLLGLNRLAPPTLATTGGAAGWTRYLAGWMARGSDVQRTAGFLQGKEKALSEDRLKNSSVRRLMDTLQRVISSSQFRD